MEGYSVESYAEKIYDANSSKYFKEVLVNYHGESYRSAVVMLWSVVIYDVIKKLKHLEDVYDDPKAKKILKSMKTAQENNQKDSKWELALLDDVCKQTDLLTTANFSDFQYLQQQRHLSAHPVLNERLSLHEPSRDSVRALMRSALEGVLVKPPFLAKNILSTILEDLSENSLALPDYNRVKVYLRSRYLNQISDNVSVDMFKSLWKLVFKLDNEQCNLNRGINSAFLRILLESRNELLQPEIAKDRIYFSNVSSNHNIIFYLVAFLHENNGVYSQLTEDAKIKISNTVENRHDCKMMSSFMHDSISEFYNEMTDFFLEGRVPGLNPTLGDFNNLLNSDDSVEWQRMFCKLIAIYYTESGSFNTADQRFSVISNYLYLFEQETLEFLFDRIEGNSQTSARGAARIDHKKLLDFSVEKGFDINYRDYQNCFWAIKLPE